MNDSISLNARQHRRGDTAVLILIVIIGAGLRAAFLDRIVRFDEAMTYHRFVSKSLIEAISNYEITNNHPLHSFQANIAVSIAGNQPWILRLPALMAGILIIPAAYLWAKEEYGERVGLLTAGLTASASFLVDYSTRARGYSLTTLMFVLSLVVARRLMKRWDNRKALVLAVLSALALFTIPVAIYSVGMVLGWLTICLLIERPCNDWAQIARGGALMAGVMTLLTIVLYTPIIVNEGISALIANRFIGPLPWPLFLQTANAFLQEVWQAWFSDLPSLFVWVMVPSFFLSVSAHRKLGFSAFPVALTAIVLPIVIILQRIPPFPRLFIFLMPVYLGGIAAVMDAALRWLGDRMKLPRQDDWIRVAAVTTVLGLGGIIMSHQHAAQWDIIAVERASLSTSVRLASRVDPGDGITGDTNASQLVSYYLDTTGQPVVLISGDPRFPFHQTSIPSRLYVLVQFEPLGPLRMARFILGQIDGFDPTAYTAPELIEEIDGIYIYVVNKK